MLDFFRKLFKALNSSAKPWQLSGAIVLAMFAGFLPMNSLILFDLFFIALVLNVNFGLFLLSMAVFSGIGYLFDPLFESLGYALLTMGSLEEMFTSMYNTPMFRWAPFNYTLVAGSLLVSTVLALPLFLILNRFVRLYREQIGTALNTWKITAWMKLFDPEANKASLFRWWGVGVFGALGAVVILFIVFLFDPLAKRAMEKSLSYALQTEVNVGAFESDFTQMRLDIKHVQIADKAKLTHNALQWESVNFDLDFGALMEQKISIEKMQVKGLAFDVLRQKPAQPYGALKPSNSTQEQASPKTEKNSPSKAFTMPKVEDILAKESLASIDEAKAFKEKSQNLQKKWEKESKTLEEAKELEEIKSDAKALEKKLKGADIATIASAGKDIKALNEKVKALKAKYKALQDEFKKDQETLSRDLKALKNLPTKDYERLKAKYSLNAQGGANLIGTFVDRQVGEYLQMALKYYAMVEPYLSESAEAEPEEITPPRGEGRWIHYANLSNTPELVIKQADVNLRLEHDEVNVQVKNLSSNQKLYGKAMEIHADAKGKQYQHIVAKVIDDRRGEKHVSDFDVQLKGYAQDAYELGEISLDSSVNDVSLKGQVVDAQLSAKGKVKVSKAQLGTASQKRVDEILKGISAFNIDLNLKGDVDSPKISVRSDLDKQLSKGLTNLVNKERAAFEQKLKAGIMKKAGASSEGLGSDLGDFEGTLKTKMDELSHVNTDFKADKNPLKKLKLF